MYLCIDTISKAAGITLASDVSALYIAIDPMRSSEGILKTIDKVLKKAGVGLPDIEGALVIRGPGSFTGLRVGLSVANQFAHQLKIPILGLRTDEWFLARAQKPECIYLQTMNKEEAYLVTAGKASIEGIQDLVKFAPATWLGQLSDDHRSWLPSDFTEMKDILSIEKTWQKLISKHDELRRPRGTYDLVEPFYGKEPAITQSKKLNMISIQPPQNPESSF